MTNNGTNQDAIALGTYLIYACTADDGCKTGEVIARQDCETTAEAREFIDLWVGNDRGYYLMDPNSPMDVGSVLSADETGLTR